MLKIIHITALIALTLAPLHSHSAQPLSWPSYGTDHHSLRIDKTYHGKENGFTNALPDVVGPLDGSAKLTIFTEGNHYPVLLPLALEAFPNYCASSHRCDVHAEDILIVTLPQVMIVEGMKREGFRFGNAVLPVTVNGPVFPDLLMLGEGPMQVMYNRKLIHGPARVFAKHRGMGLLLRRDMAANISDFQDFAESNLTFVLATPNEKGARNQYMQTIQSLIGSEGQRALMQREVETFPGRLTIQHRDIPYAVMNNIAPAGILFAHLAKFYAAFWPEDLVYIDIPSAAAFGSEIMVANTIRQREGTQNTDAFLDFLFDHAPELYEQAGFFSANDFSYAREIHFSPAITKEQ